jgi:hypothetical protein
MYLRNKTQFDYAKINHHEDESKCDFFINAEQVNVKKDEKQAAVFVSKNNPNLKFKRVKRQTTSNKRLIVFFNCDYQRPKFVFFSLKQYYECLLVLL